MSALCMPSQSRGRWTVTPSYLSGGLFFFGALGRVHSLQSRRRLIRSAIVHHSGARVKRVSPVGFTRDDTRHMLPCSVIYRIQPTDGSKRRIAHALLNVIKCEY